MVEKWRVPAVFLAMATAALIAFAANEAGAQPPVAKPQPPPKPAGTETTKPAPTPPAGQTATSQPSTGQPAAGQPKPAASGPPIARPTVPATAPSPSPANKPTAAAPASAPPNLSVAVPGPAAGRVAPAPSGDQAPTEAYLGSPILPNAQYLGSYDAGGAGQRFYLFGTVQRFTDVVGYYRTVLKDKGELVFDTPPTYMFEVGKFREEQVAFPPGVTVKDYTMGGSPGLANPKPGASPAAFSTVIQIVPPAVVAPAPARR